jgi:hypothetical protein
MTLPGFITYTILLVTSDGLPFGFEPVLLDVHEADDPLDPAMDIANWLLSWRHQYHFAETACAPNGGTDIHVTVTLDEESLAEDLGEFVS